MTRKIALSVLCLLLAVLSLFSGWKIYSELSARQKEKDEFSALAALVEPPATEPSAAVVPEEATTPEKSTEPAAELRDLTELFAQNPDCIGWLCVPGTQIDYPVMFTPEEPQRYLRRSFYGAYSQSGVPFMDFRCDENSNLILYGHNMKNGSMFHELVQYKKADFFNAHPIIYYDTPQGRITLRVIAAYAADATEAYNFIFSDLDSLHSFVAKAIKRSPVKLEDVNANAVDKIFSLQTCSYETDNSRTYVLAVPVEE